MTVQLPPHRQILVAISFLESRRELNEFSIEVELRRKSRHWNGPQAGHNIMTTKYICSGCYWEIPKYPKVLAIFILHLRNFTWPSRTEFYIPTLTLTSTISGCCFPWLRHQMETFSESLALCEGIPSVTGGLSTQRSMTSRFGVFFDLRLNKRLRKQSRFETPLRSLWRHCNVNLTSKCNWWESRIGRFCYSITMTS